MSIPSLIPSSFLPHLPRSQYSFSPLLPSDLIAHVSILRELYLPPIHGGFSASDVFDDEQDTHVERRSRREANSNPSIDLVHSMEGMGLGLSVALQDGTGSGERGIEGGRQSELEDNGGEESGEEEEEDEELHLDPFEREWAEKWLGGVVRRAQGWLESVDSEGKSEETKEVEAVLRDATAVLAMMAGTSAAGSLTRHLAFPISDALAPALSQLRSKTSPNLALSPETNMFLASLSTSPTSPSALRRALPTSTQTAHTRTSSGHNNLPTSPTTSLTGSSPSDTRRKRRKPKRQAVLPVLLHDAPMGDHLSVGVQTWGSAILLGRQMALRPADFGLFLPPSFERGVRVLELGAGTGLLSILCRKLLDLHSVSSQPSTPPGLVVATDFLRSVLDNLKICVDLNFPPRLDERGIETSTDISRDQGIHIAKLDWTSFPHFMENGRKADDVDEEEMAPFVDQSFDLVLASDCVYDETHAKLLREVAGWVLRLPDDGTGDQGGTFHILSPLRPTFAPELESIDTHFPSLSTYTPLSERRKAATSSVAPPDLRGEGLGLAKGLKLGARGEGKRGVRGRKGEGRVDEAQGYWWWEVGWG
ncbi:hypothetical protein IAR55_001398 [Kwoniella newhampshirensis]|uniref:Uncharacterized protein n=1 Tax=Kwoniella newhampshirensis TaxID=1651941 RepID=A0AAW0Z216_9TREE